MSGSLASRTAAVREIASAYTAEAVAVLATIMRSGESEAARVSAAREILDRSHGKPRQGLEFSGVATALSIQPVFPVDPIEAARVYRKWISGD
jgi:hypothetical protein